MLKALLERLAPHEPIEDQIESGPDTRSFLARLEDADTRRAENANIRWSTLDYKNYHKRPRPYWELSTCTQITHQGLGIDAQFSHTTGWSDGFFALMLGLGPFSVSLQRTSPRKKDPR